mgnify:CR=1 FL=1
MPLKLKSFPFFPAIILAALVARLMMSGLSWIGVVAMVLAVVWFGIEFVRWLHPFHSRWSRKEAAPIPNPAPPQENLISLVFFLSEPREADESSIRKCISHALGVSFDVNDPDSEHFVIPFSPPGGHRDAEGSVRHFMVRIPEGLFSVLVSDRPYIEDPKSFARGSIRDKRLRNAVEKHLAWISVDLMDDTSDPDRIRDAYRVIGRILASMGGPDCLAIYCPEIQRCNEFDPGLLESLAGDDPISLFNEPTFEPVIEISENNPKMAAAVKEAVTRWPEFVSAFRSASNEVRERFIVKAEFREGKKSEYMWVAVGEITPESVSGILMNDPHELFDYHRGASVSFKLDRLNDWIYPDRNGSHIGGFTLDVLADSGED